MNRIDFFFDLPLQLAVRNDRREKGIKPDMPMGEERERIRQESMKNYKKPTIHINKNE